VQVKDKSQKNESNHQQYIISIYQNIKNDIITRLGEFNDVWENGTEEDIFCELVFCLFTPQSKAKSCAGAVEKLVDKDLIFNGSENVLSDELNIVRFKHTKAKNLIMARQLFISNGKLEIKKRLSGFNTPYETREWLVENVRGMGYKEASHLLRNLGMGGDLAILDRHILKNLVLLKVIDEIPKSMSPKKYLEIEKIMIKYAKRIKIPSDHLDLVLWYKETGEIFK